jgi:ADP-ribose pyrophosphatase YjhB (NUDIX family)
LPNAITCRLEVATLIEYCSDCGTRTQIQTIANRRLNVCPSCQRIFFRNPKLVVVALIEDKGRVLLVLRDIEPGRGLWGLPGGYVDWDEHPEDAVVRESAEETGAQVAPERLLGVQHVNTGQEGIVILAYQTRLLGGEVSARDEVQQVGWFSPEALPPLAFPSHRRVLHEWASDVRARLSA